MWDSTEDVLPVSTEQVQLPKEDVGSAQQFRQKSAVFYRPGLLPSLLSLQQTLPFNLSQNHQTLGKLIISS